MTGSLPLKSSRKNVADLTIRATENLYAVEPVVNMLENTDSSIRLKGIHQLRGIRQRSFVCKMRNYQFDPSEEVQREIRRKIHPVEMFYRRKFFYFQNKLKKHSGQSCFKLGFAVTCLRYGQIWVEEPKLQDYFFRQSLKYFNQLIRIHEPRVIYFYYRGQVFQEIRQYKLAIEDFKKVLHQKSNHTGSILALIHLYWIIRQPYLSLSLIHKLQQKPVPPGLKTAMEFWNN